MSTDMQKLLKEATARVAANDVTPEVMELCKVAFGAPLQPEEIDIVLAGYELGRMADLNLAWSDAKAELTP